MGLKDKKLLTLKEIDGPVASHDGFMKHEVAKKKDALGYVNNVSKLAEYIGGEVVSLGRDEDWAIKKEFFPGVEILFIYNRADEEFPSNLRILYSGNRVKDNRGEDLTELTVACVNQMLRYVKETVKNPPEICTRV